MANENYNAACLKHSMKSKLKKSNIDSKSGNAPEPNSSQAAISAGGPSIESHNHLLSWTSQVSRYQWLVLVVAWLGWIFDSMDGTLYSLVQKPSMIELLGPGATEPQIAFYSRVVLAVMLIGWATGGIVFGALADYIGRTKALVLTVLIYSLFTGLSAMAQSWVHLAG